MTTISLSPSAAKKRDLVAIPRQEYDDLIRRAGGAKVARASRVAKKPGKKLPRGLQIALREVREGKLSGPFNTPEELFAHLDGPGA